ncbi:hypothetical protein ACTGYT_09065 [Streptococcus suis]
MKRTKFVSTIQKEPVFQVLFLPFVKSIKVFDEKYFESRNPNMEIILFWTKV